MDPNEVVSNEINEMLDTFEGKKADPEPSPDPDPAPDLNPNPEPKPDPDPAPDPDPSPEPKPDPEPEPEDKDKTIADLRRQIEELSAKGKVDDPPKTDPTPDPPKDEPLKLEEHDFVGDLDLDDLTRDKSTFNKLLNNVYSKGVLDSKSVIGEAVLRAIPDIVKTNISIMTSLKEASDNFYKENEDLAPFKKVVAMVFEEVAAKNPDKQYSEILGQVGDEARKRLNLQKQAQQKKDDPPPRLPQKGNGGKSGGGQKPNLSPMESELAAMNETLSRR